LFGSLVTQFAWSGAPIIQLILLLLIGIAARFLLGTSKVSKVAIGQSH
jgi:hypothetical protein